MYIAKKCFVCHLENRKNGKTNLDLLFITVFGIRTYNMNNPWKRKKHRKNQNIVFKGFRFNPHIEEQKHVKLIK